MRRTRSILIVFMLLQVVHAFWLTHWAVGFTNEIARNVNGIRSAIESAVQRK